MPELLHYREWQGQFRAPIWGVWPIARVALGMLFRRRLFWALYSVGLLIFLMFFFGGFLLSWLQGQMANTTVQVGSFRPDPQRIIERFRRGIEVLNGSQHTYAYFFGYQGTMVMVTLALTGAVLVGKDYLEGSVPFFLAKPISRWHYILGKCLAVGIVVNMLTTLPALVLYGQKALDNWNYIADPNFFGDSGGPAGMPLLLGILGYGLLLTVVTSLLLVAVASWVRRTVPLVMVWSTIFLFSRLVASVLVNGLRFDERWRLIDLWNNLRLVGRTFLSVPHDRIRPQPQPETWEAILVLSFVCVICLIFLNLRTRAVEIVK